MTDDLGLGVRLLEVLQKEPQGGLLLGSASVGTTALFIFATDVADANGVAVVVLHVRAGVLLITTGVDSAILIDHPVIADHGPVLGAVPAVNIFDSHLLAGFGAGAVHYDVEHLSHRVHLLHDAMGLGNHAGLHQEG